MKINTRQAADILGYRSTGAITALVLSGALQDYSLKTKDDGKRRYFRLDEDEVRNLAKTHTHRTHRTHRNGHAVQDQHEPTMIRAASSPAGRLSSIEKRLAALETKIDKLLTLWD